jgi:hypothetical protein
MPRRILLGLTTLVMAVACGCGGDDKPVLPTAIQQPPGMDAEAGLKGGGPKKRPKAPDPSAESAVEK